MTDLKPLSPSDLADALESGKYTRKTKRLSAGPNSKANCCLGVAARVAGFDLSTNGCWSVGNLAEIDAEDALPWLQPYSQLNDNLMILNDGYRDFSWRHHIIPLLRALSVNKDGQLSKRQNPDVQWFIDDEVDGSEGEAKERLARIRAKQKADA